MLRQPRPRTSARLHSLPSIALTAVTCKRPYSPCGRRGRRCDGWRDACGRRCRPCRVLEVALSEGADKERAKQQAFVEDLPAGPAGLGRQAVAGCLCPEGARHAAQGDDPRGRHAEWQRALGHVHEVPRHAVVHVGQRDRLALHRQRLRSESGQSQGMRAAAGGGEAGKYHYPPTELH